MHRSSPTCHRAPRARTRRRSPRPHPERRNRSPLATRRCCPCRGSDRPGRLPSPAPHRSGRARLTHPALRSRVRYPRHVGVRDARLREREPPQQCAHALPVHARALRAAVKPLAPRAGDLAPEASKGIQVPGDPEVPVTSPQLLREGLLLRSQVVVEVLAAPTGNLTERSPKAVLKALGRKLAKPHQQPASRPRHS